MKVVLPGSAPRVSGEAGMFEGLVFEDMANMNYCQLMVDEFRRVVVSYQGGVTRGKAITGCAIGPVLMYLDCLIHGKTPEPDMRVPRICFMDPVKLSDLVDADLIKKGNADPKTWMFGKLPVSFVCFVSCRPFFILGIAIFCYSRHVYCRVVCLYFVWFRYSFLVLLFRVLLN